MVRFNKNKFGTSTFWKNGTPLMLTPFFWKQKKKWKSKHKWNRLVVLNLCKYLMKLINSSFHQVKKVNNKKRLIGMKWFLVPNFTIIKNIWRVFWKKELECLFMGLVNNSINVLHFNCGKNFVILPKQRKNSYIWF